MISLERFANQIICSTRALALTETDKARVMIEGDIAHLYADAARAGVDISALTIEVSRVTKTVINLLVEEDAELKKRTPAK